MTERELAAALHAEDIAAASEAGIEHEHARLAAIDDLDVADEVPDLVRAAKYEAPTSVGDLAKKVLRRRAEAEAVVEAAFQRAHERRGT